MFNLDGLIPKLCVLAQEMGEDSRVQRLRSAGLQTLASVVISMTIEKSFLNLIVFLVISFGQSIIMLVFFMKISEFCFVQLCLY